MKWVYGEGETNREFIPSMPKFQSIWNNCLKNSAKCLQVSNCSCMLCMYYSGGL